MTAEVDAIFVDGCEPVEQARVGCGLGPLRDGVRVEQETHTRSCRARSSQVDVTRALGWVFDYQLRRVAQRRGREELRQCADATRLAIPLLWRDHHGSESAVAGN